MEIFFISFIIILIAVTGMAVGFLFGGPRRCIKGSCGGVAAASGVEENGCACGRSAP